MLALTILLLTCIIVIITCYRTEDGNAVIEKIRHGITEDYNFTIHQPFVPYEGQIKGIDGPYNYSQYQPYAKIEKELHNLADGLAERTDDDVTRELFSIGKTFEGRDIWALKVERKPISQNESRKVVLIECGAHAREWISVSTCMYLVSQFSRHTEKVKEVMEKYDWVFIPVLNPDGYVFTWYNKSTRSWRKNRSVDSHAKHARTLNDSMINMCIGVDINRNFDVMWGGAQAPTEEPCDNMYPGTAPFSEKESTAFSKYVLSMKDRIIAYFSLHTFSLKWATPWAHQKVHPSDYDEMKRVADIAVESIKKFAGISYMVGSTHDILYPTSGTSTDWVYAQADVIYTYLVEMIPAKGNIPASFMLPPEMMVLNSKDMLQGIVSAAQEFKPNPRTKSFNKPPTSNKTFSSPLRGVSQNIVCNNTLISNLLFLCLCISYWGML